MGYRGRGHWNNHRNKDMDIDLSDSSWGGYVRTRRGDDNVVGSEYGDWITTDRGNDTVEGGGGNDIMFGGRGQDVAVFSGSILDYNIISFGCGGWTFVSGEDGCDFLNSFEQLRFDDFTYNIGGNNGPLAVLRSTELSTAENDSFAFAVDVYDLDGDAMSVQSVSVSGGGTVSATVGLANQNAHTGSSNGIQISFDPGSAYDALAVGETATETVTLTVSDGRGGTTEVSYEVTIEGENDGPVATAVAATASEDGPAVVIAAAYSDVDASDVHTISVDASAALGAVTNNGDGTFSYDASGAFDYLADGETATDTFTFTVDDGNGGTSSETVTVTVSGQNDAPVATAVTGSSNEDGPAVTISADVTDVDASDSHIFSIDTTGTLGLVVNNGDGTFNYDAGGAFEALAAGETATDTFTYTVDDGNGGTDTETVTVTVTGQNDAPVALAISAAAGEDGPAVPIAANYSDVDASDDFTVSVDTTGTLGTVINNGDGTFDYDTGGAFEELAIGETTTDTFTYTVDDGNGGTATETVTVTITGSNDAPIANADVLHANEETGGAINIATLLANDTDIDNGATLAVSSVSPTSAAGAQVNLGNVSTVLMNEAVNDGSFESNNVYNINNANGAPISLAGWTITTTGPNIGGVLSSPPHSTVLAGADGNDGLFVDGNSVTTATSNNLLGGAYTSVSEGDVINWSYDINDWNDTGTGTLELMFGASSVQVGQGTPSDGTVNGFETISGSYTVTEADAAAANAAGGTLQVALQIDAGSGNFYADNVQISVDSTVVDYTPGAAFDYLAAGETATDTFTYTVDDGNGGTDTETVTVTVTGENDGVAVDAAASTVSATVQTGTTFSGNLTPQEMAALYQGTAATALTTINGTDVFYVAPGGPGRTGHTFVPLVAAGQLGADAVVSINIDGSTIRTSGDQDAFIGVTDGNMHMSLFTTDGGGGGLFSDTVAGNGTLGVAFPEQPGINDRTGIGGSSFSDFSLSISLDGSNDVIALTAPSTVSGDAGAYIDPSLGLQIVLANDGSPERLYYGGLAYEIEVEATDASGQIVFDDPDLSDIQTASVTGLTVVGKTHGASNAALKALLSLSVNAGPTMAGGSVDWSFVTDPALFEALAFGEAVTLTYEVTIDDGNGGTTVQPVTITVEGLNDGPMARDISASTTEDAAAITIAADFTDADVNDSHSFDIDTTDTLGTVINNGDGTFDYAAGGAFEELAVGETATDSFTYVVDDGNGGVAVETVTVTITGTNDAPDVQAISGTVGENDPAITIAADFSDADASDTHTFSADTTGTLGLVTNNGDGTFGYDANGAFEALAAGETATDTFTYTVDDGNGGVATETATITVNGQNDAPVLAAPTIVKQGISLSPTNHLSVAADPGLRADNWTVEAWIRTTETDASYNRVVSAPVGGGQTYSLLVRGGEAHIRFDNGSARQVQGVTVADGEWHHIAGTFDSVSNTLSLYVDGVFVDAINTGSAAPYSGSQNISIGQFSSAYPGTGLDGEVADVRIWSVTRDATEIANSFDQPLAGTEAGLELYLPLDGTVEDLSTNAIPVVNTGASFVPSDAPVEANHVLEDGGSVTFQFTATDVDASDVLTYSADTTGVAGQVINNGDGSFDYSANGAFEHLKEGETATENFAITVSDGNGGTDTQTVSVTIVGQNDAPVADAVTASVAEDAQTVISGSVGAYVLPNAGRFYVFDFDTGVATTVARDGGANNTAQQIADQYLSNGNGAVMSPNPNNEGWGVGAWVYVDGVEDVIPSSNFVITDNSGGTYDLSGPTGVAFPDNNEDVDAITVTVSGITLSDGSTVNVTMTANQLEYEYSRNDDLRVASVDFQAAINHPSPEITIAVDVADVDGDTFVFGVNSSATLGSVTDNGDGTFDYSANGAFEHLNTGQTATDSFVYTVDDGNGGTDSNVVTVTIIGSDDLLFA